MKRLDQVQIYFDMLKSPEMKIKFVFTYRNHITMINEQNELIKNISFLEYGLLKTVLQRIEVEDDTINNTIWK